MRWMLAISLVLGSLAAHADASLTGNDTGGIIQWLPEADLVYRDIAEAHCARWNRTARITSVHRTYGDYVGFRCIADRRYDPRGSSLSWTQ